MHKHTGVDIETKKTPKNTNTNKRTRMQTLSLFHAFSHAHTHPQARTCYHIQKYLRCQKCRHPDIPTQYYTYLYIHINKQINANIYKYINTHTHARKTIDILVHPYTRTHTSIIYTHTRKKTKQKTHRKTYKNTNKCE